MSGESKKKKKAWENSSGFNGPWISPVFVSVMVLSSSELGKLLNFRSNKEFWIFNSKALLSPCCVCGHACFTFWSLPTKMKEGITLETKTRAKIKHTVCTTALGNASCLWVTHCSLLARGAQDLHPPHPAFLGNYFTSSLCSLWT